MAESELEQAAVAERMERQAEWLRRALEMRYCGPLTLADAVEQGSISQQYAAQLVHTWQHAEHKQFAEMPAPEISRSVAERGGW